MNEKERAIFDENRDFLKTLRGSKPAPAAPPQPAPDAMRIAAQRVVDAYVNSERATPVAVENAICELRSCLSPPLPSGEPLECPGCGKIAADTTHAEGCQFAPAERGSP